MVCLAVFSRSCSSAILVKLALPLVQSGVLQSFRSLHVKLEKRPQTTRGSMDAIFDDLKERKKKQDAVKNDSRYISWSDLDLRHLPEVIRSDQYLKVIKDIGKRVVRLVVKISEDRKKEDTRFKDDRSINGSGFALWYHDDKIVVSTNKHVLWNEEEVRNTTVYFFFEDTNHSLVEPVWLRSGSGIGIIKTKRDDDFTLAVFKVDHETRKTLVQGLDLYGPIPDFVHRIKIKTKRNRKAVVCVISHPLGMTKRVSFGDVLEIDDGKGNLLHTAATESGSSGGVIIVFCPLSSPIPNNSICYHTRRHPEDETRETRSGGMQINNDDLFKGPKLEQMLHQVKADSPEQVTDMKQPTTSKEREINELWQQTEYELYSCVTILEGLLMSSHEVNGLDDISVDDSLCIRMKANALNIALYMSEIRYRNKTTSHELLSIMLETVNHHMPCRCSVMLAEDKNQNVLPHFTCPNLQRDKSEFSDNRDETANRPEFCFLDHVLCRLSYTLCKTPVDYNLDASDVMLARVEMIMQMIYALSIASRRQKLATQTSHTTTNDQLGSNSSTETEAEWETISRRCESCQTFPPTSCSMKEENMQRDPMPHDDKNLPEQRKMFTEALNIVMESMQLVWKVEAGGLSIVRPLYDALYHHHARRVLETFSRCISFLREKEERGSPNLRRIHELVTKLREDVGLIISLCNTIEDQQLARNGDHGTKTNEDAERCTLDQCDFSTEPRCCCPRPTLQEFRDKLCQLTSAADTSMFSFTVKDTSPNISEVQMWCNNRIDYICKPKPKDESGQGRGRKSVKSSGTVGRTQETSHAKRPAVVEKAREEMQTLISDLEDALDAVMMGDTSSLMIRKLSDLSYLWSLIRETETEHLRAYHNTYTFRLRAERTADELRKRENQEAVKSSDSHESMTLQGSAVLEKEVSLESEHVVSSASAALPLSKNHDRLSRSCEAGTSASAHNKEQLIHRALDFLIPLPTPKEEQKLQQIIAGNPKVTFSNLRSVIATEWPDAPESVRVLAEMAGGQAVKNYTEKQLNLDDADFTSQFPHQKVLRQVREALDWLDFIVNEQREDRRRSKKKLRKARRKKRKSSKTTHSD